MTSRFVPAVHTRQLTYAHTYVLQWKDPMFSTWRIDIAVELARCHMMHKIKQNKRAHTEH